MRGDASVGPDKKKPTGYVTLIIIEVEVLVPIVTGVGVTPDAKKSTG